MDDIVSEIPIGVPRLFDRRYSTFVSSGDLYIVQNDFHIVRTRPVFRRDFHIFTAASAHNLYGTGYP